MLVHGVPEGDNDDTDALSPHVITNDVGVELKIEDRIGSSKSICTRRTKPRAIIVRFSNMRKRIEVYKNKKKIVVLPQSDWTYLTKRKIKSDTSSALAHKAE